MKRVSLGLCLALACSAESGAASRSVPRPDDFVPLSSALGARCGSLDCHGRVEQNLRLHGKMGLRLDPLDRPGGDDTTPPEHEANYQSVVALEPEALSRVWQQDGQRPDRLSLVRKARGAEHHKGGTIFPEGDPGDTCILSWLAGATDAEACSSAAELLSSPLEP